MLIDIIIRHPLHVSAVTSITGMIVGIISSLLYMIYVSPISACPKIESEPSNLKTCSCIYRRLQSTGKLLKRISCCYVKETRENEVKSVLVINKVFQDGSQQYTKVEMFSTCMRKATRVKFCGYRIIIWCNLGLKFRLPLKVIFYQEVHLRKVSVD